MAVKTARKLLLAFNRGVVSALGLARIDLKRMGMSAETQTNWMPRVLGSMMLRPGFGYKDNTRSDLQSRLMPFVFSEDDTAQVEISASTIYVRIDDSRITRPAVTSAVTNGSFDSNVTSWTDIDESGCTSAWLSGGYLQMIGNGTNFAGRKQQVTTVETGTEHALRVIINRGSAIFKVGSSDLGEQYVSETRLGRGDHSLAFTPTGDFYITVTSELSYTVLIDSIEVESAGVMSLPTLWTAAADLKKLRWDQSGDVIYVAANGFANRKIERRAARSWSVVFYEPVDGPFRVQNTSKTTIATSAISGDVTLTASKSIFKSTHVGGLFRVASVGQTVTASIAAQDTFTGAIRVTGVDTGRVFSIVITGISDSTVTVQYSVGAEGAWVDLATTYVAPVSTSYDDGQDNQIIYYRIGIKTGDYGTDTCVCTLSYAAGSISGVARINAYSSGTSVTANILKDFGATSASADWWEGEWSDFRGYPTATRLHEGRLWWLGKDKIWGSISDAYESFDDEFIGDAGPISRSIGSGPIAIIHWALSLGRLLMGTASNSTDIDAAMIEGDSVLGARSSSFGEPLTPSNFNLKDEIGRAVYVDRSKQRLYELTPSQSEYTGGVSGYESLDLSVFTPDFNSAGIVQIAVQIKPDVRIHCVRADGTVGVLIFDRLENVICWITVTTPGATGLVEDVSVLPGAVEDQVYYIVKRTVNSATVRTIEKWALESECVGDDLTKLADGFVVYDSTSTTTPFTTELLHLRDETVEVWADGKDVGTHTVSAAGAITLSVAASKVVAGLGYTAQFKGTKLASVEGVGLNERKKVSGLGFILKDTHYQGLKFGPSFSNLDNLPKVVAGSTQADDTVWSEFDEPVIPFKGVWDTDSRICLQAAAPRPCTVLAAVGEIEA